MADMNAGQYMNELKAQVNNAYAQEFFATVREKCFEKCISKPGTSLSSGDVSVPRDHPGPSTTSRSDTCSCGYQRCCFAFDCSQPAWPSAWTGT